MTNLELDETAIRDNERIKVILDIIGSITGIGETNCDDEVIENLNFLDLFLDDVLLKLLENVTYNGYEGSMLEIKQQSIYMLENIADWLNEELTAIKDVKNSR